MENVLEPLYMSPEMEEAYIRGVRDGKKEHMCTVPAVVVKEVIRVRKNKWGVVSNGQLLNPSFKSEADAAVFLAGLIPANPANREHVKIDAMVVKL